MESNKIQWHWPWLYLPFAWHLFPMFKFALGTAVVDRKREEKVAVRLKIDSIVRRFLSLPSDLKHFPTLSIQRGPILDCLLECSRQTMNFKRILGLFRLAYSSMDRKKPSPVCLFGWSVSGCVNRASTADRRFPAIRQPFGKQIRLQRFSESFQAPWRVTLRAYVQTLF